MAALWAPLRNLSMKAMVVDDASLRLEGAVPGLLGYQIRPPEIKGYTTIDPETVLYSSTGYFGGS